MAKYFKWALGGPKLKFFTHLDDDQCFENLYKNTDKPKLFDIFRSESKIVGTIKSGSFSLYKVSFDRGYRTYFNGNFTKDESGSIVEGIFKPHPIGVALGSAIISLIILFLSLFCVVTISNFPERNSIILFVICFISLAGIASFLLWGKAVSRSDEEIFTEHISKYLQAKLIERSD